MICDLGLTDYEHAYGVQKDLVARRKLGEIDDSIIITEHAPVFTIGRTGDIENLLVDKEELERNGISVLRVDRGGDITCHAPGQLVAYPVLDLKKRGRDLHRYMRDLEEIGIQVLMRFGIAANRQEGKTGIWAERKKIASVGIAASDWVTYHGISININNDLRYFSMINPCGMNAISAISLQALLGNEIDMDTVKMVFIREFYRVFGAKNAILAH